MTDSTAETPEVEAQETPSVDAPEASGEGTESAKDDTFPRSYVEDLRKESARYRERSQGLAKRLHSAIVAATGRLADPADLDFDEAHLDDEAALTAAIDGLLASKPHLASRRPRGDVGQGVRTEETSVSLGTLLRARV